MSDWNFACPDWEERLRNGRSLMPALPLLDRAEAGRAVRVFNKLRLPDVVGKPTLGEAAAEWPRDIAGALNGSIDAAGTRHVQEIFALLPKKNSKTTNGAGIMLTAVILNRRPRAEFILVGPTQEVADLAFQQAEGMIAADEEGFLQKRFQVRDHIKTFDMKVMTGAKPTGVLIDELHVLSSVSYAHRVIGQIRGGLLARPDGFLIFITTQSDEPPAGVFRAELQLARGIRDGRITGDAATMLPILYEFPEAMQIDPDKPWADPSNWSMVNPNLGRSVTLDGLKKDFAQANEKGAEEIRRWASQHLNIEIGLALHTDRWIGADYWEAQANRRITLEALLAECEVAVVGIDGGGLDDLVGLGVIGRHRRTRDWWLWTKAWAQKDVLAKRKEIAPRLLDFVKDGDLVLCERPTQDVEEIAAIVAAVKKAGVMPEKAAVGLDPIGVAAIVDALAEKKISDDQIVGVTQGYRLSGAVWGMERKLKDGTLWHSGSRLMAWCVGNAKTEQRGNAVLITKQAAGKAKIDPLIAAFDAVMLMSRNPEAPAKVNLDGWLSKPGVMV